MKTLIPLRSTHYGLILTLLLACNTLKAQDTLEIKGRIIDFETKAPVAFCAVALSGTSLGSITDENGRYVIQNVPNRPFQIIASHIGYQNKVMKFDPEYPRLSYNMSLKVRVTELETVAIETRGTGKVSRLKRRNLEQFKRLVFGAEYKRSQIEITNEEILDFGDRKREVMRSDKTYDLEIVNYHLGYEISYLNLSFKMDGKGKMFVGNPTFREMTPDNEEEALKWKTNREKAYKGSLKHFFYSLVNNRLDDENFLANLTNEDPSQRRKSDFRKKTEQLRLKATKRYKPNIDLQFDYDKGYFVLKYKDLIELFHIQDDGRTKQSLLKMNTRDIKIYPTGALRNPLSVIVFGELAFKGVYQMLPSNYQPDQ